MHLRACLVYGSLSLSLAPAPVAAQQPVPAPPAAPERKAAPTTLELLEDLRILSIVNALQLTRDQAGKLAGLASAAQERLAQLDAEFKKTLEKERSRALTAREKALRGDPASPATDTQLAAATQAAEGTRAQKTELLIQSVESTVRRILSVQQAQLIESELAPNADQPWRRYARMATGPAPAGAAAAPRASTANTARLPVDPAKWLKELRDLRLDSAEGDPAYEVEDFARKMTTGLPRNAPDFEQTFASARTLASQVLQMPPDVFGQREWQLARLIAKQELDTRNQQRIQQGRPVETFDPYRWFVEQVMLSPRAAVDLKDRAAAR